ncbi:MAG: hypothetical protein A2Y75_01555 [Candidatus Solincola sediminis]|uniref:DNA adenine methylase n=1 Tax=Candidatus Solincola sediminis TaxID=1797199 RepID=A0A1F2WNK6_9ACTN|nr:MAG: hypothetical protein A2Y75_01555 [Candidatus Solincola sediminis]
MTRHIGGAVADGASRQIVHLGNTGRGVNGARAGSIAEWFAALSARLARVRVCSGDWSRVCGPSVTYKIGLTGIFLDPPYADTAKRTSKIYREDSVVVAHAVREWAIANGNNTKMRIALCGYDGEHVMPASWECVAWKARGGYGSQGLGENENENNTKERIWFSPHCQSAAQGSLF